MKYFEEFVNESYREIDELKLLADDIGKIFANRFQKVYSYLVMDKINNSDTPIILNPEKFTNELWPVFISTPIDQWEERNEVRLDRISPVKYKNIKRFVERSYTTIIFSFDLFTQRRMGSYNNHRIEITMNNDFYNKLIEFVLSDAEEYSNKKITPNQAIKSLTDWYNSSIRSTIIHELQHAVDAYKSNEQNVLTPQAREYSLNRKDADYEPFNAEVEKKLFKDYLNLPHEIWGRFAEAASNTWMILNGKQIDVHNYIDKFKLSYDNFDDLSKKNQQIILKAAYKYYDLKKDEFVK